MLTITALISHSPVTSLTQEEPVPVSTEDKEEKAENKAIEEAVIDLTDVEQALVDGAFAESLESSSTP